MVLALLGMMILPLPALALDMLFTFNITLSLVVLLVTVYARKPLDFAIFPSVLLVATLLRLALNVASTRVVLLKGHEGGDAAGKVIQSFGEVVIGGNYVVGLVVFLILIIINFVVVTKGAGRVSEVTARFTLDAMPGKQMAIDADLNAGILTQEQAKARRQEIAQESEFYGSMDGASKFVRGDAVAGILILIINIVGGLAIGVAQHDLAFADASRIYVLLTIGDGLVAQVPSLLLSTAAAMIVTRATSDDDMGVQVRNQLGSPKALAIASGVLMVMAIVPGMPHIAFGLLSIGVGVTAYYLNQRPTVSVESEPKVPGALSDGITNEPGAARAPVNDPLPELSWDDVEAVDRIGLEVGYRLIPLVDRGQGGQLLARVKGVRKKLSRELGFLLPSVHIRDNLELSPTAYRLTLNGVAVGEAEINPDMEMAINPGQVFGNLDGERTQDPAFGLDAVWIPESRRDQAQSLGYTVVDASTVVATHLNQILVQSAHELLSHDDVNQLLEKLRDTSPKLAENLVPESVSLSQLLQVLKSLLREEVPVRDFRGIAEALTAAARQHLARVIIDGINGNESELRVIALDPELEQLLLTSVQQSQQSGGAADEAVMEPQLAERLQRSLIAAADQLEMEGRPPVLLVSAPIRPLLARFARFGARTMHVLAYQEVPENKQVTIVANVGQQGA
ncbi:flagellar biosynthesis protein FlhA [Litorivicinus lipolyticus]|uniref:Flagellar biosynthesis protein FlhA n=2 Tax=Litorivicinus lipolyticus TaxID=418701 RepID=A0A5Q2QG02_9GAMM|nr:flagellar biosynthesis protein FlhA [Litorivicinus lipolyticus]